MFLRDASQFKPFPQRNRASIFRQHNQAHDRERPGFVVLVFLSLWKCGGLNPLGKSEASLHHEEKVLDKTKLILSDECQNALKADLRGKQLVGVSAFQKAANKLKVMLTEVDIQGIWC